MERLLKSRYRIRDKIGESPFSITYRGTFLEGEENLVIKIYKRSVLSSHLIKSVKRKVKDLSNLTHSSVAKVIDGDYGWQGFYFVREYVNGKSLSEILSIEPRIDPERALKIIFGICEALAAAHSKGIIHGALNPNNVILADGDSVKLTDFILMGDMRGSLGERAQMAYSQSGFLSPEEVMGEISTRATDIYSVGLLSYLMLCGRHPFVGKSDLEMSLNIMRNSPDRLRGIKGDIPSYLEDIVLRALEKNPGMRFKSISNLMSSLRGKSIQEDIVVDNEFSEISLDGLIETANQDYEPPPGQQEVKEGSRPKIVLVASAIILAALFGIGYAVVNALMNR